MYSVQDVYDCSDIDNKLHWIKINVHYSLWNHPSKVHKWREKQNMKEIPIYSIYMNIGNGQLL